MVDAQLHGAHRFSSCFTIPPAPLSRTPPFTMAMAVMASSAQATARLQLASSNPTKSSVRSLSSCASVAVRGFQPLSLQARGRLSRAGPLRIRAAAKDTEEDKVSKLVDAAPKAAGSAVNQLLGIKGASAETNKWKIRLQLTKPVTWAPLIWGVLCGAAASGNFQWTLEDVAKSLTCMLMSGPLLTGYTQTINDWYDREIDAINEPYRPIPSGAISEPEVIAQIWILLLGGLGVAYGLDRWAGHDFPIILCTAIGGSFLSYIYSAPPLKLKQSGWIGNYALGSSYISLPWWAGQALFGTLSWDVVILTLLYSTAGLGIAIVNDFKSIEGDRQMGLQSLPVAFGIDTAKYICAASIDVTQLAVAAYILYQGKTYYGLGLLALIIPQIILQFKYLLVDPVKYDVKYQASAQPFFVFGLLLTALATSH